MANWPTPTFVAWFGTENCYLAMAAMRPDPPRGDGPGLPICTGCAAQMSMDLLPENASAVSPVLQRTHFVWLRRRHGDLRPCWWTVNGLRQESS